MTQGAKAGWRTQTGRDSLRSSQPLVASPHTRRRSPADGCIAPARVAASQAAALAPWLQSPQCNLQRPADCRRGQKRRPGAKVGWRTQTARDSFRSSQLLITSPHVGRRIPACEFSAPARVAASQAAATFPWLRSPRCSLQRPADCRRGQKRRAGRYMASECPRPRRRDPGRCVPVVAFPLIATYSALPTVGGAKSAVPGDRHGNFDYMHSMPYTKSRGRRRRASYSLPRRQPPRGIWPNRFFAE
jgi:hypothetical protein